MRALLLPALILVPCLSPAALGQEPFADLSLEEARAQAAQLDRILLIDFFTTWCEPCKRLDRTTWKDERVLDWLNKTSVCLKVDAEDEDDLARRYDVQGFPTLLFLRPNGTELGRIVGYRDPQAFLEQAQSLLRGISEVERLEGELEAAPNDPLLQRSYAKALMREGRQAEALAAYLWCFDHGLDHAPDFAGVRTSFLLADIAKLGRSYPPAIAALREREAAARRRLLAGEGTTSDAVDAAAVCRQLSEEDRVLDLWDALSRSEALTPALKQALFPQVMELMIDAERYGDVLAEIGDVFRFVDGKTARFKAVAAELEDESLRAYYLRQTLVEAAQVYRVLLAAGDARAATYRDRVLAFDASALAFSQLVRSAAKARAWQPARDLLRRGYADLDEADHSSLKAAERKLPKAERLPRT